MINWPWTNKEVDLELVSIHIPKSAGTSFRLMLEHVYGSNEVVRLDMPRGSKQIKVNQKPYDKNIAPPAKVIHGHFNYALLRDKLNIDPEVPVITWLRHPVDRVISNYYYLRERLMSELDEKSKGLNILSKMMRSLEEYAHGQVNRNRMTKFLAGTPLEELAFVGIVEDFEDEVQRLARVLDWKDVAVKRVNKTSKKPAVDDAVRKVIEDLNQEDMELYSRVLEQRKNAV